MWFEDERVPPHSDPDDYGVHAVMCPFGPVILIESRRDGGRVHLVQWMPIVRIAASAIAALRDRWRWGQLVRRLKAMPQGPLR